MGRPPDRNSKKDSELEAWEAHCTRWNEALIQGRHSQVVAEISELNFKKIPRDFIHRVADLAWRSNDPLSSLKILHPIIHPENHLLQSATPQERIIYASALTQLGATTEAIAIFNEINSQSFPEVLLRKSFAHFKVWEYQTSLPFLQQYIELPELSPYQRLIGKVNLAAALIFETEWDLAQALLDETVPECKLKSYTLLHGNCLELSAQINIFCGRYTEARQQLEEAQVYLKDQKGDYSFFVEKWLAVCQCYLHPTQESFARLHQLKETAKNLRQWENIRDCDLFEALIKQNQSLANKLIIGTPYKVYRQRVRRLFGKSLNPQGHFNLILGESDRTPETSESNKLNLIPIEIFDPYNKQDHQLEALYQKKHLLTLFEALTKDFYKPSHIGLLFERVYPEEQFNPYTSPSRVLQLLRRLNQWFTNNNVSLQVVMEKSEFRLDSLNNKPVEVIIRKSDKLSKTEGQIQKLKSSLKHRTFTAALVAESLNISRVSAQSLINEAIEAGVLKKSGVGRGTVYQFNSSTSRKSIKAA